MALSVMLSKPRTTLKFQALNVFGIGVLFVLLQTPPVRVIILMMDD